MFGLVLNYFRHKKNSISRQIQCTFRHFGHQSRKINRICTWNGKNKGKQQSKKRKKNGTLLKPALFCIQSYSNYFQNIKAKIQNVSFIFSTPDSLKRQKLMFQCRVSVTHTHTPFLVNHSAATINWICIPLLPSTLSMADVLESIL